MRLWLDDCSGSLSGCTPWIRICLILVPVLLGGFVGVLAGTATVQAMCLPGTCEAIANTAGVVTGIGGIVGVGLVVALTVRSFDEYRTAIAAGKPPPSVGCETDELS